MFTAYRFLYQNLIMSLTLYTLEYNTYEYKEAIYVFYGRKQELKTLEKEYLKKNSLCSIYGARRIGKTSLISEFVKDKKSIMFQAKEVSDNDNLKSFSAKILESFDRSDEYTYSSWKKAFDSFLTFEKCFSTYCLKLEYEPISSYDEMFNKYI